MLRQTTSRKRPPTGVAAAGALSALSAWMHHTADAQTTEALTQLRRLHNVAPVRAETAVIEAYELLERFGALDRFLRWAATDTGALSYWPHLANVA